MRNIAKLLLLGGLFAAAAAQAQVDFYITGSTAFRANAYRSVRALYGANLVNQNPANSGTTSGSNIVTFTGTLPGLFGAQIVTVHTSYSGSAAGIQALVQNTTQTYLASGVAGDPTVVSHQADLGFSDVFQSTTAFPSTPGLNDSQVGVLPFVFVRSINAPTTLTNITIQQLQSFLSGGIMPLSYFTGN